MKQNNIDAFFALLKAGLWERDVLLAQYGDVDYDVLYQLAEEQSVTGLAAAGLEHVIDVKLPKEIVLQFIGQTLQLEQQNKAMNSYIESLVEKMREAGIYALLVKGQGVAQCYERPLWRACGDIDLILSDDNYNKAKEMLLPLASDIEPESKYSKHLGMTIDSWVVELHGSLRMGVPLSINHQLDEIKNETFYGGNVSSWANGRTQVFMLSHENNVVYVFAHFLAHFYKGGIGLRQICDWCRLLWTYRDSLNHRILKSRIMKMGLMSEWSAFGTFAVEYLGLNADAVPFLNINDNANVNRRLKKKAERIKDFILMSGNFGHNRDMSYYDKYPYVVRKIFSMKMRVGDLINHARIFPLNSIRFSFWVMFNGLRSAVRGE